MSTLHNVQGIFGLVSAEAFASKAIHKTPSEPLSKASMNTCQPSVADNDISPTVHQTEKMHDSIYKALLF